MLTIYLCFLAGGAVLPVLNFVIGFLSHGLDADMNTDISADTNLDMDTDFDLGTDVDVNTESGLVKDISAGGGSNSNMNADMNADIQPGINSFFSIGLIPTSFLSVSTLAIIFGASGALMTIGRWNGILAFILSIVFGYLASVIVQSIINSLKKIQTINHGVKENELLLYDGKIVDTILPGKFGTVSFITLENVLVSYPARCVDENMKLEAGRVVKVKEIKNGIFIVEPKNKYEN